MCPTLDAPVAAKKNAEYNSKVLIDCKGGNYCNFSNTRQQPFSGIAGKQIHFVDTVIHID